MEKTRSTKEIYYETVRSSFIHIENFCIKNNIDLDKYRKDWAIKHIRSGEIDGAVAIYLKLVDKNELNKVQKMLLHNLIKQYNIIVERIRQPELNMLLASLEQEMKKVIKANADITLSNKQVQ